MLLCDTNSDNYIFDYCISFDDESKKFVLEILDDCLRRRKISLPTEETFLLHKDFTLSYLKGTLEYGANKSQGGSKDLLVYHYTFGEPMPKKSVIGDLDLGEEVKVSRTAITCPLSSTISLIIHHLSEEDRKLFISRLNPMEKAYIERLLSLSGDERLTNLLGEVDYIEGYLKRCQSFKETMPLDDIRLLEEIQYFKTAYSYATLTPSKRYDRAYLDSIVPVDDMEREEIQDIQDASYENTALVKKLTLEPKQIRVKKK